MLPAVTSLHATAVRIVGYTVVLWALTLLFAPVAGMGALIQVQEINCRARYRTSLKKHVFC